MERGWYTCIYERGSNKLLACVPVGSHFAEGVLGQPTWHRCAPGEMYYPADSSCRPDPPAGPTARLDVPAAVVVLALVILAMGACALARRRLRPTGQSECRRGSGPTTLH